MWLTYCPPAAVKLLSDVAAVLQSVAMNIRTRVYDRDIWRRSGGSLEIDRVGGIRNARDRIACGAQNVITTV
jgi:hypothetical protein